MLDCIGTFLHLTFNLIVSSVVDVEVDVVTFTFTFTFTFTYPMLLSS